MTTLLAFGLSWAALAVLVSGAAKPIRGRLRPQTRTLLLSVVLLAFVAVPFAALATALARGLAAVGSGSGLERCGRLFMAIVTKPLARPDLSVALAGLAILAAGLFYGLMAALRSQRESSRLTSCAHGGVAIIDTTEAIAFTAGLINPRIVLSRGLVDNVKSEWLDVVVAHESAHVKGRHPLILFFADAIARGLPVWPISSAARQLRLSLEMSADDHAVVVSGSRDLVAQTISGLALASSAGSVGFDGDTAERVARLTSSPTHPAGNAALLCIAGALAIMLFAGGHVAHCATNSLEMLKMPSCPVGHQMARTTSVAAPSKPH